MDHDRAIVGLVEAAERFTSAGAELGVVRTRRQCQLAQDTAIEVCITCVALAPRWVRTAVQADGEVAQGGHRDGNGPVQIWEWSSAKTTSRIQCRRFSMLQCADLRPGHVGDRVDSLGVPFAAGQ
jgi:hypothetical protein